MGSQASVASSQPDQRHLRLIAASAQANEARVRDILAEEPPWTSVADHDALRLSLQKVSARGKLAIVRLLLDHGAELNSKRESEVPALVKAAEGGHVDVVIELLKHNADLNGRNRNGQTALFGACIKGYDKVVETLLAAHANVEAQDNEGRSPLLFLASEKPGKGRGTIETVKLLIANGAVVDVKDQIGRTPLLWAATNGNVDLARILIEGRANVAATNNRGRTALHLAAESNHGQQQEDMVKLLLHCGANPGAVSDGGWTPLHNATQGGYAPVVSLLLQANANVNAELSNGMTPLHWAAFNGFKEIVQLLLAQPDINLTIKDSFNRTPMICAAEKNHPEIVQLLSPTQAADRLSPSARQACLAFEATIVDFGQFEKKQLVSKCSVYELLYGWDNENDKPKIPTLTKNIKYKPDFRWIHLPANNIAWVEALLAKSFIEAGHRDIEAFKALEKCFDQEHRGKLPHANFMRTFSQRITAPRIGLSGKGEDKPLAPLSEEPSDASVRSSQSASDVTPQKQTDYVKDDNYTKKRSKSEQLAERHPKKHKRGKGPPGNPHERQDSAMNDFDNKFALSSAWGASKFGVSNGKIVLFMPFLHYETDMRRRKMGSAIKSVYKELSPPENLTRDALLVNAYLKSTPPLHPRRTLDQFFYHGIDTSARDEDQVVYRYCKRHDVEPKVFMVDQLWLWIIGKDLVITCFSQRWEQPKQDPLNVLDGIIEETNAKTRPPIGSVCRCAGTFDRHRLDDQDLQFFDMFDSSIGLVTDRESKLFRRFNQASAQSAQWLQRHRGRRMGRRPSRMSAFGTSDEPENAIDGASRGNSRSGDQFPDALLDIDVETSLLAEIKDIRDELNIIAVMLDTQLATLADFEAHVTEELRASPEGLARRAADTVMAEVRKRAKEQARSLEIRHKDVWRMDQQAESLYHNVTDLLDLKQKHSNALEARFAGDQAVIAARQGQTIMVFTIVTIVFLPMSFIASFFAINLEDWEGGVLTIPYVSKYMFGIGLGISIPLIAMAFTVADIADATEGILRASKRSLASLGKRLSKGGTDETNLAKERAHAIQSKAPPSSQRYRAMSKERDVSQQVAIDDLPVSRMRHSREWGDDHYYATSRLSPVSGRRLSVGGPRTISFGSATATPWPMRPSLDRSRGRRLSEDLERGRDQAPFGR
ncbi:ankyrin repeat and protein kinase domain-containing protein 1 [Durotheca rogersii]|uniref:ankyrin repeat and protein kinase domain-containing protein 1 n=1 Tax=Durotheca rogersii TaxID=419775 RepID=UPI00221E9FDA|nr:ankyrin repeat and protein kinase domain-containing protein 1 [Durotheca rogersii]KAI5860619.1 ankyrin repeat and protein kinase domain-containing protein 1 [Durotheca rogersii]